MLLFKSTFESALFCIDAYYIFVGVSGVETRRLSFNIISGGLFVYETVVFPVLSRVVLETESPKKIVRQ